MKILAAKKQDQIWDWTLFFFILLYLILPAVYRSYSVFLIGNKLPTTNGLAIVSQWQFIQVFLEILQEAFVLPIFFFIGSKIKNSKNEIAQRIKTSFSILLLTAGCGDNLFQYWQFRTNHWNCRCYQVKYRKLPKDKNMVCSF